MTDDKLKDPEGLPNETGDVASSAPDERDATIERLERAIAAEREHAATLRKTVEELRFRADILETSYTKQLDDAWLRSETAERELADQQAQMAALETDHENALKLLAEARAELERVPAARGQRRKTLASIDGAQDAAELADQEGTINKLMRDSSWAEERQSGEHEKKHPAASVPDEQDSPTEELVAPELVFTAEGDDES